MSASLLYVGTNSQQDAEGIRLFRFDATRGRLEALESVDSPNVMFLAVHPNGRFLYAAGAPRDPHLHAFRIAPDTGALTFVNSQPSHGRTPCHLSVDRSGQFVLVANYTGGNVAVFPIREDGGLGPATEVVQHEGTGLDPKRQEGPHPHSVVLSPDNRFALVADLGTDLIAVYRFDTETGRMSPNDPPSASVKPGAGCRHMTFHPNGRFLYAINELDNTVTAFGWDASRGALDTLGTISALPADFSGESYCAGVVVSADARFLYGSNRGHDSVAVFAIDQSSGLLSTVAIEPALGGFPTTLAIDPTGEWLLVGNQRSDTVVVFRIDSATGGLSPAGKATKVSAPMCLTFIPSV